MKKQLIITLMALVAVTAFAVTLPRVNMTSFKGNQARVLNNVITSTETAINLLFATVVDTNVTTTTTSYTPAGVGQFLVGGAGTGTNALWCATGATTNDWTLLSTVAP